MNTPLTAWLRSAASIVVVAASTAACVGDIPSLVEPASLPSFDQSSPSLLPPQLPLFPDPTSGGATVQGDTTCRDGVTVGSGGGRICNPPTTSLAPMAPSAVPARGGKPTELGAQKRRLVRSTPGRDRG